MTLDASTRPTASPIVRVLNEEVRHYHRWCTPSTLVDQERIDDFYASDVSISAGFFGTLVDHTRGAQLPPLDDQRDQGVRARLPLPPVAV